MTSINLILIVLCLIATGMLLGCPIAYLIGYRRASRDIYSIEDCFLSEGKDAESDVILDEEVIEWE